MKLVLIILQTIFIKNQQQPRNSNIQSQHRRIVKPKMQQTGSTLNPPSPIPASLFPTPAFIAHMKSRLHQSYHSIIQMHIIRMLAFMQETNKFNIQGNYQDIDGYFYKILGQVGYRHEVGHNGLGELGEIKESIIYELTNIQMKSEQHCMVVMMLLCQLAKWVIHQVSLSFQQQTHPFTTGYSQRPEQCQQHRQPQMQSSQCSPQFYFSSSSSSHPFPYRSISPTVVHYILNQGIKILKFEKKNMVLINKSNQLLRILMKMILAYLPIWAMGFVEGKEKEKDGKDGKESKIEDAFVDLYSLLICRGTSVMNREEAKKNYNKCLQECFQTIHDIIKRVKWISSLQIPMDSLALVTQYTKKITQQLVFYTNFLQKQSISDLSSCIKIFNMITSSTLSACSASPSSSIKVTSSSMSSITYPSPVISLSSSTSSNPLSGPSTPSFSFIMLPAAITPSLLQQIFQQFSQLVAIYQYSYAEIIMSRLKILKALLKVKGEMGRIFKIKDKGQKIQSGVDVEEICYVLLGINHFVKTFNLYIWNLIMELYDAIMAQSLQQQSMIPLYLYTNIILNNFTLCLQRNGISIDKPSSSPQYAQKSPFILIPNLHSHASSPFLSLSTVPSSSSPPSLTLSLSPQYTSFSSSSTYGSSQKFNQLCILEQIFKRIGMLFTNWKQLEYFLRLYDWNFMEEEICIGTIKMLYGVIQREDMWNGNENVRKNGKMEYQLVKKWVNVINHSIEQFLKYSNKSAKLKNFSLETKKHRKQFYELKKKQYQNFITLINTKPKQLFKKISHFNSTISLLETQLQSLSPTSSPQHQHLLSQIERQKQLKQCYIQKIVTILRKSIHVQMRTMIDVVGGNTPQSGEILDRYLESFFRIQKKGIQKAATDDHETEYVTNSVEHFLRYVISNFFLTGQSQQILRFLDKATQQFFTHQSLSPLSSSSSLSSPSPLFSTSDSIYTFSNAIILLNSDQHNPKNPNKMTFQQFTKICQNINNGKNLPIQVLKATYTSIKEQQIKTYRSRYGVVGIGRWEWGKLVQDVGVWVDDEIGDVCGKRRKGGQEGDADDGFEDFVGDVLAQIIDQKQTQKLQQMVHTYQYSAQMYTCPLIQTLSTSKSHLPLHILHKIYEQLQPLYTSIYNPPSPNSNSAISTSNSSLISSPSPNTSLNGGISVYDKMISYVYLAGNLIDNFYQKLSYGAVAQYLVRTYMAGYEIKDNMYLRISIQWSQIRSHLKTLKSLQQKKSLITIFSKFLSSPPDEQPLSPVSLSPSLTSSSSLAKKRPNISNNSFNIFNKLMQKKQSRVRAAWTMVIALRVEESRRFQEFLGILGYAVGFVYGHGRGVEGNNKNKKEREEWENKTENNQKEQEIENEAFDIFVDLVQDVFMIEEDGVDQQSYRIGKRIQTLKQRNLSKFQLLYSYLQFWTLKIFFSHSITQFTGSSGSASISPQSQKCSQKIQKIYKKCLPFLQKINKQLLEELISILNINFRILKITKSFLINSIGIPKEIVDVLWIIMVGFGMKPDYICMNQQELNEKQKREAKQIQELSKQQSAEQTKAKNQQTDPDPKKNELQQKMQKQITKIVENPDGQNFQQDIQQRLNLQLGLELETELQQNKKQEGGDRQCRQGQKKSHAEQKNFNQQNQQHLDQYIQNLEKSSSQNLNSFNISQQKNEVNQKGKDKENEKQSEHQNQSNQELGLPIYML